MAKFRRVHSHPDGRWETLGCFGDQNYYGSDSDLSTEVHVLESGLSGQ